MDPKERELRVKPIQRKEKKTFCECAHFLWRVLLSLCRKLLNFGPSELRNLRTNGSEVPPSVREETSLVSCYPK